MLPLQWAGGLYWMQRPDPKDAGDEAASVTAAPRLIGEVDVRDA